MTLCKHGCGTELPTLSVCTGTHMTYRSDYQPHTPERCRDALRALLDEAQEKLKRYRMAQQPELLQAAEKRAVDAERERDEAKADDERMANVLAEQHVSAVRWQARAEQLRAGKCLDTIPDTLIACGEGGNYCSEACRLRAALKTIDAHDSPEDAQGNWATAHAAVSDETDRKLIAALYVRLGRARGALYDTELGYEERRAIADSTAIDVEVSDEEWDAAKAALDV